MDAYRAVVDKRDQRAFLDRPIPDDALARILQAGRMTGSSKNREPNRFVVVRDRARLAAIAALSPVAKWVARAAVVVVIVQTERHEFDAGRCAQNMMIAAWREGIGSCPAHVAEAELGRLLGMPPDLAINRLIAFGYIDPARSAPPAGVARRRLPLSELVHDERW
jgi:nitroreductase